MTTTGAEVLLRIRKNRSNSPHPGLNRFLTGFLNRLFTGFLSRLVAQLPLFDRVFDQVFEPVQSSKNHCYRFLTGFLNRFINRFLPRKQGFRVLFSIPEVAFCSVKIIEMNRNPCNFSDFINGIHMIPAIFMVLMVDS